MSHNLNQRLNESEKNLNQVNDPRNIVIENIEEEVMPFNGEIAFGVKTVSCGIIKEDVRVLWPDDQESIEYLTKWVNNRLTISSVQKKIIMLH